MLFVSRSRRFLFVSLCILFFVLFFSLCCPFLFVRFYFLHFDQWKLTKDGMEWCLIATYSYPMFAIISIPHTMRILCEYFFPLSLCSMASSRWRTVLYFSLLFEKGILKILKQILSDDSSAMKIHSIWDKIVLYIKYIWGFDDEEEEKKKINIKKR